MGLPEMAGAGGDAWQAAMRRGDFAAAWAVSDAVLHRSGGALHDPALPRHCRRLWDGRPLAGQRVLVHCWHGLGDTLQFVRLLPLLRRQAAAVDLLAQPALLPLLAGIAGADRLLPLDDRAPPPECDAEAELMELAHVLRLTPERIPAPPYLPLRREATSPAPGLLRTGLAWRAGDWDRDRSLPEDRLAALAAVPGVQWHSLQLDATMAWMHGHMACTDLARQAGAMLDGLDLVVSVDTMTAHLAGALGLPTWLLLPTPCDWRWMDAGADSPWYPAMRIFRQPRPGDWDTPLRQLADALREHARLNGFLPGAAVHRHHTQAVSRNAVPRAARP